jgi:hypothetical protein
MIVADLCEEGRVEVAREPSSIFCVITKRNGLGWCAHGRPPSTQEYRGGLLRHLHLRNATFMHA